MAALYPDTLNRRILVKNLPPKIKPEKLMIYFQKKQHGGCGDVESITYPKSRTEQDQAIVAFEEGETMESVLRYRPHIMNEKHLDVTEFPEQALGKTTVDVSEKVRLELIQKSEFSFEALEETTGVKTTVVNNSISMSGQWYQIMAAADIIDGIINDPIVPQTEVQSENTSVQQDIDSQGGGASNFTLVTVDSNVHAFFKKCYPIFEATIAKKHKVSIEDVQSKIVFRAKKLGTTSFENAANEFKQHYSKFEKMITREFFDMKNLSGTTSQDEIDKAIKEIMRSNKNVSIFVEENSYGHNHRLIFMALSKWDCENAVDEFKCFFIKTKKLSSHTLDRTSTRVIVVHGNFRKETSGAMISEIDSKKTGLVVSAGGEIVTETIKKARITNIFHHSIDNSSGKCNLYCGSIIHYLLNSDDSEIDFEKAITTCLELANKVGLNTVSLPMSSLGTRMDIETVRKSIINVVSQFASTITVSKTKVNLSEIRVIFSDETEAHKFEKCMSDLKMSPGPTKKTSSGAKSKDKRKSSTKEEEEKDVCAVCLDDLNGAMEIKSLPCKHTFHKVCIQKALSVSNKCPICMRFYGNASGDMPRGTMHSRATSMRLPGFKCDTIVIDYNIPDGRQGPEHPNPGRSYRGTSRMAYLPNNSEGRELLLLLRKAFEARLTFTVGRSVTTGMDNCVTWNDIHHKTTIHGGSTGFGYPDPGYLTRLRKELADKGITN